MKLRHVLLVLPILLLLYCLSNELGAKTTNAGGITGVVSDASHAVVPEASVELRNIAKGTNQTARTGSDGLYRFFFVTPGRYTLTVSHPGFREERREVNVLVGPPGTWN